MLVDEYTSDRRWLTTLRDEFEAELPPQVESRPEVRNQIRQALRLVEVALDYHIGGMARDRDIIAACVSVAATLGREWTGLADDLPSRDRLQGISKIGDIFTRGVLRVVKGSVDDPALGPFLTASLMTWGIFYDKLELDFPEP